MKTLKILETESNRIRVLGVDLIGKATNLKIKVNGVDLIENLDVTSIEITLERDDEQ